MTQSEKIDTPGCTMCNFMLDYIISEGGYQSIIEILCNVNGLKWKQSSMYYHKFSNLGELI